MGVAMRDRQWQLTGLVCAALLASSSSAFAYIPRPACSYKVGTVSGQYVFVMISPAEGWPPGFTTDEAAAIRRQYKQSGVYRNDGSADPVWVYDGGYYYDFQVNLASDGHHLIIHQSTVEKPDTPAIIFYAGGRVVRSYTMNELVRNADRLKETRLSWRGYYCLDKVQFDEARMEYRVVTKDGNRFVFDVRTGEMVSASRPLVAAVSLVLTYATIGAAGIVAWLAARRWRNRRKLEPANGVVQQS
jgi:hypothetical protein